jgi:hypothetical protein
LKNSISEPKFGVDLAQKAWSAEGGGRGGRGGGLKRGMESNGFEFSLQKQLQFAVVPLACPIAIALLPFDGRCCSRPGHMSPQAVAGRPPPPSPPFLPSCPPPALSSLPSPHFILLTAIPSKSHICPLPLPPPPPPHAARRRCRLAVRQGRVRAVRNRIGKIPLLPNPRPPRARICRRHRCVATHFPHARPMRAHAAQVQRNLFDNITVWTASLLL